MKHPLHDRNYLQPHPSETKSFTTSTSLATPEPSPLEEVPVVCVPGSGERLPPNCTRVYTLPTCQCNATRICPFWEFQPPVGTFLSCAYRPGRTAGCLFWFPIPSHCHRHNRWPEAFRLSQITAEAVTKAFVSVWVAGFDHPPQITTKQGRKCLGPTFQGSGYYHRILSNSDYCVAPRLQRHDREATPTVERRPYTPSR